MNDPFASFDGQRTFIKPNPGGRPVGQPAVGGDAGQAPVVDHGLTPLLAVANRLLLLVPNLRKTQRVADLAALRATLAQGVRDFESQALGLGLEPKRVEATRYILCTVLDEAASDTPWGGQGAWARHSLLAEFHNDTKGGEKVFQLMAMLADKPDANRDLLEVIYAAVSLGFEGRYRHIPNGAGQLEAVRAKLAQLIRQQRGPYQADLAPHWAVQPVAERRMTSWLPLALTAALSLLLLGGAYAAYALTLATRADPVYGRIQSLRLPPPVAAVPQLAERPRLAVALQADIRANLVAVRDEVDRSVVTLRGDTLFAPASATLSPEHEALLRRVGEAMVRVGGAVRVTGHTDNTPIRTLRFPSNWHLSEERARAVRQLLVQAGVPGERIQAEGRGEGDPLSTDNSPAARAANRRVEITLLAPIEAAARTGTPAAGQPASPASR